MIKGTKNMTMLISIATLIVVLITLGVLVAKPRETTNLEAGASNPCGTDNGMKVNELKGLVSAIGANTLTVNLEGGGVMAVATNCPETKFLAEEGKGTSIARSLFNVGDKLIVEGFYADATRLLVHPQKVINSDVKGITVNSSEVLAVSSSELTVKIAGGKQAKIPLDSSVRCRSGIEEAKKVNKSANRQVVIPCGNIVVGDKLGEMGQKLIHKNDLVGITEIVVKTK